MEANKNKRIFIRIFKHFLVGNNLLGDFIIAFNAESSKAWRLNNIDGTYTKLHEFLSKTPPIAYIDGAFHWSDWDTWGIEWDDVDQDWQVYLENQGFDVDILREERDDVRDAILRGRELEEEEETL